MAEIPLKQRESSIQPTNQPTRGVVENVSANQSQAGHLVFPIGPRNTNFAKDVDVILLPVNEFRSAVSEKKSKVSQLIRGQGGHLVFPIGLKNTNLVEDVEILLSVMFC